MNPWLGSIAFIVLAVAGSLAVGRIVAGLAHEAPENQNRKGDYAKFETAADH